MRLLIIGSPSPEIERAAAMAASRGALVDSASLMGAVARLKEDLETDLILIDDRADIPRLVETLRQTPCLAPVIAYGTSASATAAADAIRGGASYYLRLPATAETIERMLRDARQRGSEPVSSDPRMRLVLEMARQFAPSNANILISGESGTGKEVIARFIHRHSRRTHGAFVSLNCAAIPDSLLESELFGHEKGAFTGAAMRRIGKFEEAQGGTLLLDEVTEMAPRLQAKLLRAIQEREIDRVGGTQPIKIDIRLIATSNRDLEQAVTDGIFREDLYFRLNVINLELPPLRERRLDIAPLARHFAEKYGLLNGLGTIRLTDSAIRLLEAHHWRGNVRELENCIHRAVLVGRGSCLDTDALMLRHGPASETPTSATSMAGLVGRTLAEVERSLILQTIASMNGNRTRAAALLGISIRTLRNKLKEYAEERPRAPARDPSPAIHRLFRTQPPGNAQREIHSF